MWKRREACFSTWPNWAARATLAVLAALAIWGALLSTQFHGRSGINDLTLYRAIVGRVAQGENYYDAAAAEHRLLTYPTAPAQVFREPALAWTLATLRGDGLRRAAVVGLSFIVFIALMEALARSVVDPKLRVLASLLIGSGLSTAWFSASPYFHEVWAALLIALSLASQRFSHWSIAILLGVAACLIRELAFPYLVAMAAFAVYERKYRELGGWIAGITAFSLLYAWHLSVAATLHQPGDLVSPGWFSFGGWPFVVQSARMNSALLLAPNAVVAPVVCLAIIGFARARDPWLLRVALTVCGYLAAFSIVGRPANLYWGLLISPLLPIGVALSPMALRDLLVSAWGRRTAEAAGPHSKTIFFGEAVRR